MSEFKFACPVCGQHITCDSSASGTYLECPTCYAKIIVPQAPTHGSTKLILTAAHATGRSTTHIKTMRTPAPAHRAPTKKFPVLPFIFILVALGAVGIGFVVMREETTHSPPLDNFPQSRTNLSTNLQATITNALPVSNVVPAVAVPSVINVEPAAETVPVIEVAPATNAEPVIDSGAVTNSEPLQP